MSAGLRSADSLLRRIPVVAFAGAAVIFILGILGGLWRIGWEPPLPGTQPATFHGALMVAGFFGTLIGLERAAGAKRSIAYAGPLLSAVGGLGTAFGAPHPLSASLLLVGMAVLATATLRSWRQEPTAPRLVQAAGALCGVAGNAFWLFGLPAGEAVGAWAGFLILTIVGERLEVSHMIQRSAGAQRLLAGAAALCVAGGLALPMHWRTGAALVGAGIFCLSLWMLAHDVARRNLRHHGLMRFTAVCVVAGYFWLGLGGPLLALAPQGGPIYDAALHSIFLGFVFGMVFGHLPVVLPSALRIAVPWSPLFYAHLALLEVSLALRVAGDLLGRDALRSWGGAGNAAAIAAAVVVTAALALRSRGGATADE